MLDYHFYQCITDITIVLYLCKTRTSITKIFYIRLISLYKFNTNIDCLCIILFMRGIVYA